MISNPGRGPSYVILPSKPTYSFPSPGPLNMFPPLSSTPLHSIFFPPHTSFIIRVHKTPIDFLTACLMNTYQVKFSPGCTVIVHTSSSSIFFLLLDPFLFAFPPRDLHGASIWGVRLPPRLDLVGYDGAWVLFPGNGFPGNLKVCREHAWPGFRNVSRWSMGSSSLSLLSHVHIHVHPLLFPSSNPTNTSINDNFSCHPPSHLPLPLNIRKKPKRRLTHTFSDLKSNLNAPRRSMILGVAWCSVSAGAGGYLKQGRKRLGV